MPRSRGLREKLEVVLLFAEALEELVDALRRDGVPAAVERRRGPGELLALPAAGWPVEDGRGCGDRVGGTLFRTKSELWPKT